MKLGIMREIFLRLERGHAAHAGRGYCLAINFIGDIAGSEDAAECWFALNVPWWRYSPRA